MRRLHLAGIVLSAVIVAACGKATSSYTVTSVSTNGTESKPIILQAAGKRDAQITQSGDLSVANKSVDVTAVQHRLLEEYYLTSQVLRGSGEPPGGESAHPNPAQPEATALCNDLVAMKGKQEHELEAQLPLLKPYLHTGNSNVTGCVNDWR